MTSEMMTPGQPMTGQAFAADLSLDGEFAVIRFSGDIDAATRDAAGVALWSAVETGRNVIVDLDQVTFMDSSGLHVLIEASCRLRAAERRALTLRRAPQRVRRLFEIAGIGDVVTIES
jgi:anti-anti-sigma factor